MQLVNREKTYANSLGQDDVASVLKELVQSKCGFTYNGEIYLWDKAWIKYPIENLNEDIRSILRNRWNTSKARFIKDSVLHNSQSKPNLSEGKVPFVDGYYDIKKGTFVQDFDFIKKNKILNHQSFKYDENADCPNFIKALDEIFPDQELGFLKRKAYLQFFAYCFVPINYHKSLILVGQGANGKSTLLDINKLFFANHANIELQDFGDQNAILNLQGASMVYSHEGEFDKKAMANFKKIAEGKPLLVNKKYVDKFWIDINCKMMIATNHFPELDKLILALKRRMVVVDLKANFIGREVFNLLNTIETEKAGIFNLVIRELPELLKSNGDFAYNLLEDAYIKDSLWALKMFIHELIEKTPNTEILFSEFYEGFEQYCTAHGQKAIGKSKVSRLIEQLDLGLERFNSAKNIVKVRISS